MGTAGPVRLFTQNDAASRHNNADAIHALLINVFNYMFKLSTCLNTNYCTVYGQDKFIQSRVETMKNIEQTVVELGSIYQQLAQMVQEQGEMVQRCET